VRKIERLVWKTKPLAYLSAKTRQLQLPGFAGVPLYDVWKFFLQQLKKTGLNERAAAISFNFIMAIPAFLIVLLTLVPYFPISKQFHNELVRIASDLTPNKNTFDLVHDLIDDFLNKPRGGLLSFGFLLVIFYSSNAMMGVIRTFDRSLETPYKPNFLTKRLRAIRLTFIIVILFIATTLVLSGQDAVFRKIMAWLEIRDSGVRWWIKSLRWVVILSLFFYAIGFIYKYAPSVQHRDRLVTPGVILATILTLLTTWGFSLWVNNFGNLNRIYGSIGTVMVLMIFVFLNSLILLIGYELNISIHYLRAKADERKKTEMKELTDEVKVANLKS
jgi:membrane protein